MDVVETTLRLQRTVVLPATLVLSAVAFWRRSMDIFNLTKLTLVVAGAVVLVALSAVRATWTRRLVVPAGPISWLTGAFAVALAVSTLVSDTPAASIVGQWGRFTGLAAYLAYAAVLLAVVRLFRDGHPTPLAKAMLVAGALVVGYGLVQVAGKDPFVWNNYGLGGVFSSLGNPNFASGYVGIVFPLSVGMAIGPWLGRRWRVLAAGVAVLGVVVLWKTASFQGPAAAVAGTALVVLVWFVDGTGLPAALRRLSSGLRAAVAAAVVAGGVVLCAAALGGVRSNVEAGLYERTHMWRTALGIFTDHPVLGTGLDTYGKQFGQYRTVGHAELFGVQTVDAPHNVPLGMFANGGLLLGLTYLAVVVWTGRALVIGLRRMRGHDRLGLAAFGGAWLAYQLDSLVSIDIPPLALLHWVLAGCIVALADPPPLREVVLRGKAVVRGRRGRGRLLVPASTKWTTAAIAVVSVVALWITFRPLRADTAAARGSRVIAAGRFAESMAAFDRAHRLAPWEGLYWLQRAAAYETAKMPEKALEADERAARLDPGNALWASYAARLSKQLGEQERASRWFREAVRRDPRNTALMVEAAQFERERGSVDLAIAYFEDAVRVRESSTLWIALAQARAAAGRQEEAKTAYERALALEPGNATAQQALTQMRGPSNG